MHDTFEAIATVAIEAVEAMARDPRDAGSLLSLAASIYWSWVCLAGELARRADNDRMLLAIAEMRMKRKEQALLRRGAPRRRKVEPGRACRPTAKRITRPKKNAYFS